MSKHTVISPSQAERFFNCPGSVQAQAKIDIEEASTVYQLEGTAIHELAANCLKNDIDPYEKIGAVIEVKDNYGETVEFTVNDEFAYTVRLYRNKILSLLEEHDATQSALQVEVRYSLPEIDEDAKGTTDCAFIAGDTLYVFDLKAGRGVIVDPEENKQAMYYALRPFLDAQMFVSRVIIYIIQPRAKEGDYIKCWETAPQRLLDFAEELKKAIKATRAKNPELKAGKWCGWCKAQSTCGVERTEVVSQMQAISPQIDQAFPQISDLSPEQIGKALPAFETLAQILKQLKRYAFTLAVSGREIPNYSLSRKRKNRRWRDEQAVISELEGEYGEDLYTKKLRSPAQLEKLAGKEKVEDYIFTPEGGLTLVPTKEAQEHITRTAEAVFEDVDFDEIDKNNKKNKKNK